MLLSDFQLYCEREGEISLCNTCGEPIEENFGGHCSAECQDIPDAPAETDEPLLVLNFDFFPPSWYPTGEAN